MVVTIEGVHVMSQQVEIAVGTPTERQKGDEWQPWLT